MDRILIVEDDKVMNNLLTKWLEQKGFEIQSSVNGRNGLDKIRNFRPDMLILDVDLPDMNGFEILKKATKLDPQLVVIMITGFSSVEDAVQAMKLGALNYISKPFNNEELLLIIKRGLKNRKLSDRVNFLEQQLSSKNDAFVGDCLATRKTIELVNIVAPTDVSVVLSGRSGTGKELLARMIHAKSNRDYKPFVAIDCGAIPDTLRENEMFGHDKEAFTGAKSARKGKFEIAEGGTLFLDEIGNLPLSAQATLLRVLQEKQIVRIGDHKPIDVDVRIITATNVNLEELIRKGDFREDLFFRLNEFIIDIPTLNQRKDDIPVLIEYFLKQANSSFKKNVKSISMKAIRVLQEYNWPGNVRELKNLIYRTVLITNKVVIEEDDLIMPTDTEKPISDDDLNLVKAKQQIELRLIKKALDQFKYNKSKVAKILGISRKSLYTKMAEYDLN